MNRGPWVAVAVCLCGLAPTQALPPAFVEVEPAVAVAWQQQPVVVVVRVGYDPAFFAAQAVPLFQQRLDQPFLVSLPWLLAAEDRAVEILPAPGNARTQRIVVGDRVVAWQPAGQREVAGRRFELLELQCRWLPLVAGVQSMAPVEVRYAYATRFDEDFLRGRQPVDRQEASVRSAPRELVVQALPKAGRPARFHGAVGEFTVQARAAVDRAEVGAAFALELRVEGTGNLERFAPPPWPELPGFLVQGLVERREPGARCFVFDVLALRAGAVAVPPLAFVYFAAGPGEYRTIETTPVPLLVVAAPAGSVLPERVQKLVLADAAAVAAAQAMPWWGKAGLAAAAAGVGALLWRRHRRARRRAELTASLDRLDAAAADPQALCAGLEALLAATVGIAPFDADAVWRALGARGAGPAAVARLRAAHAGLMEARYGGVAPAASEVVAAARVVLEDCGPGRRGPA